MGGSLACILVEPNGTVTPMLRWTNIFSYFVHHPNLFSSKAEDLENWLKEFKQSWLEMKADYEANKDTGNFEHNMTSCYFPYDTKAPEDYGLVYIDLQKKIILSSQSYTSVGRVIIASYMDKHEIDNKKQLIELGYLKKDEENSGTWLDSTGISFYILNVPGWSIQHTLGDTEEEFTNLKKQISDLGMRFSVEDEAQWNSFMERFNEEDEEEGEAEN